MHEGKRSLKLCVKHGLIKGMYNGDILALARRINVDVEEGKLKKDFPFS
jgi:hypothetical protein